MTNKYKTEERVNIWDWAEDKGLVRKVHGINGELADLATDKKALFEFLRNLSDKVDLALSGQTQCCGCSPELQTLPEKY